jgi:putative ABC transport system ATP-binding protein
MNSNNQTNKPFNNKANKPIIFSFLKRVLAEESSFFWMSAVYGLFISILSLVVPLSVQFLINSVSFTAMNQPISVIGIVLFIFLTFLAILRVLQFYMAEMFQRKFFARISSEISLYILNAKYQSFEEINQTEIVNRFFETQAIKKIVPKFLTKTFTLILQTIVGLVLVAFYHPVFLAFSLTVCLLCYFAWNFFYKKTLVNAFYESKKKYEIASWLEDMARAQNLFKSENGHNYAKLKTDQLINEHLQKRSEHFSGLFLQVIFLLVVYVLTNVSLLVIGGLLVVNGQLTIGQLVAAELIFSVVLYGLIEFGRDLESFYDLVASCEKISQFQNIPQDEKTGIKIKDEEINIKFSNATYKKQNRDYSFNLSFENGKKYLISTDSFFTKKIIINSIRGFKEPIFGSIKINNFDLRDLNLYHLRNKLAIIDNSQFIEGTIREYLSFQNKNISQNIINKALEITGLDKTILRLESYLDQNILPSGFPFSESEKILLKLAKIIIEQPKVIILTEVFDMLFIKARENVIKYLTTESDAMIIYFSHQIEDVKGFSDFLFIDKNSHQVFSSPLELAKFEKNIPHETF